MIRNIVEYLDESAIEYPDKVAFTDEERAITFSDLKEESERVASAIIAEGLKKQPILVFLDKSVNCLSALLGVARSGNFYSPIDTSMPEARIERIVETLQPALVITTGAYREKAMEFAPEISQLLFEELVGFEIDKAAVCKAVEDTLDTDLLYVLFTSGSTGTPKGVMSSHRAIIDFTEWLSEAFDVDDSFVFANQTGFFWSFSIYEIFQTLKNGATTHIIPSELFSYPGSLMQFLFDHSVNALVWVPSALCMLSMFRALNSPHLDDLKVVWFGGEVMPIAQLNRWTEAYPNTRFVNVYGGTETSDTCSCFEVNRKYEEGESLPIGKACRNKEMFLLDEDDNPVPAGELGEICVRGSGLSYGYYNDPARTAEVFVQNPLNPNYAETVYRMGDIGRIDENGQFIYVCRKDSQIKHMGRRIELGEIEAAVAAAEGIDQYCCMYDPERSRIWLFYTGGITEVDLNQEIERLLPHYMRPAKRVWLEKMPLNLNGKIDRQALKRIIEGEAQ